MQEFQSSWLKPKEEPLVAPEIPDGLLAPVEVASDVPHFLDTAEQTGRHSSNSQDQQPLKRERHHA
jgi:hypothetical protein